jgi:hypothetical protein
VVQLVPKLVATDLRPWRYWQGLVPALSSSVMLKLTIAGLAALAPIIPATALASPPATYTVSGFADGTPGTCSPPVGTSESCTTLRAAVLAANANAGDPTISLGAGRFVLGGAGGQNNPLDINESMRITGAGSGKTTIAQTDGTDEVVDVAAATTVAIDELEVTGGAGSGVENLGTLTLTGDLIDHNSASGGNGVGPGGDGGSVAGGGISNDGTLTIQQSTITDNTATGGSGGNATGATHGGPGGLADGGGIFSYGPLRITDSTISDNTLRGGGGGTAADAQGGNGDVAYGGGLELEGDAVLERDTISGNHAIGGAGGSSQTPGDGGGAQAGDGGGIDFGGTSQSDTYVLVNVTVTGNAAADGLAGTSPGTTPGAPYGGNGGGISESQSGAATLANVTLVDNTGGYGGNLYMFGGPTESITIADSIIAGGSAPVGNNCRLGDALDDSGPNLEDSGAGTSECSLQQSTDRLVAPGGAGVATTLGAHGGLTETLALLAGSPALGTGGACKDPGNGGAALLVDQRGLPRPSGGPCDVGAFQAQTVTAGPVSTPGTVELGGTLTCKPAFTGDITSYTYQWLAGGKPVPGATADTFKLGPAVGGLKVSCTAAATGPRGSASATSPSTLIAGSGVPSIKGKSFKVKGTGGIIIGVSCSGTPCTTTLTLSVTERGSAVTAAARRHHKPKPHVVKLVSHSFTIVSGHTTDILLRLRGSALKLFKHHHGLPALAALSYWHLGRYVSVSRKVKLAPVSKHGRRK